MKTGQQGRFIQWSQFIKHQFADLGAEKVQSSSFRQGLWPIVLQSIHKDQRGGVIGDAQKDDRLFAENIRI